MGSWKRILDSTGFRVFIAVLAISGLLLGAANYVLPQPLKTPFVPPIAIGLALLLIVVLYATQLLRSILDRTRIDSKRAYEYLRSRYGWGYEQLEVSATINGDGSAVIIRTVTIKTTQPQPMIEQTLFTTPAVEAGDSNSSDIAVNSLAGEFVATIGKIKPSGKGGYLLEVYFTPTIAAGRTVKFELIQKLAPQFYAIDWSSADLKDHDITRQYFGWSIDRPTQSLHEWVVFPENHPPTGYELEVDMVPLMKDIQDPRPHRLETERLKDCLQLTRLKDHRYRMDLKVDSPLIGLVYVMRWRPLSARPVRSRLRPGSKTDRVPNVNEVKTPRVFLSYAHEDLAAAERLFRELRQHEVNVWFDKDAVHAGERWKPAISRAIRSSRFFIALLSTLSLSKTGYVQKELREAMGVLDQYPEQEIYLIPVRLDDCQPSNETLLELQWVDMFPSWDEGLEKILRQVQGHI
jgi:hypothetical protein